LAEKEQQHVQMIEVMKKEIHAKVKEFFFVNLLSSQSSREALEFRKYPGESWTNFKILLIIFFFFVISFYMFVSIQTFSLK